MSDVIYGIIYKLPMDYILRAMFLLLLLWSFFGWLFRKKIQKAFLWKGINGLVFLGILTAILRTTIYNRSSGASEVILIPFRSFIEAKIQPEIYRSMLMNVFLFFPMGLSMSNILPEKWKNPVSVTICFACLLSISVEFLQYYYNLGRAEIDDVLCNTFGCMLGTLAYKIEKRFCS